MHPVNAPVLMQHSADVTLEDMLWKSTLWSLYFCRKKYKKPPAETKFVLQTTREKDR